MNRRSFLLGTAAALIVPKDYAVFGEAHINFSGASDYIEVSATEGFYLGSDDWTLTVWHNGHFFEKIEKPQPSDQKWNFRGKSHDH